MNRNTTVFAIAVVMLAGIGVAAGVGGLSGTEYPLSLDLNQSDTNNATFDLRNTANGDIVLTGAGQLNGTEEVRSGTGDTGVSWTHQQRNGVVTFYGDTQSGTNTYTEDFSDSTFYESNNVSVESGSLVLESSSSTSTTTIDGFSDGYITEYSGDTGNFDVSGTTLEGSSSQGSKYTIYRSDVTVQQGDNISLDLGYTDGGYDGEAGFSFGGSGSDNTYRVIEDSDGAWELQLLSGGSSTTLDSGGNADIGGSLHDVTINWSTNGDISVSVPGTTLTATDTTYTSGGIGWYFVLEGGGAERPSEVGANVVRTRTTSTQKENGYAISEFTSSQELQEATLSWTDDETDGSVQHYVSFGSPSGFTEFTTSGNTQDIPDGTNAYVKTVLNYSSGSGPTVSSTSLDASYTTYITDPSFTLNGRTVSYTGTLQDGETADVAYGDVPSGSYTVTTDQSYAWDFTSNNDGRVYVSDVTHAGTTYTVDQFLGTGETTRLSASFGSGSNTVAATTTSRGEATTLNEIRLNGTYDAWQAIYEGIGHDLTTTENVVFDYSVTPSSDARIRGMDVAAERGTTNFEVHSWAPSNNDAESREIVDFQADDTVAVTIENVSADHEYVVFRNGEQKQELTPENGEIEFTQSGDVEVFTKIENDQSLDYNDGSDSVFVVGTQSGLLSYFTQGTGLPPMVLLIAGAGLALVVVYLFVVRRD